MPLRPPKRNNQPMAARPERKRHVSRPCDIQEQTAAKMVGGRKTRGSGSGRDKGDWKNKIFCGEAKTTSKASRSIRLKELITITNHAHKEGKIPIFELGFDNAPVGLSADWFAMPAEAFEVICKILECLCQSDLKGAQRWSQRLPWIKRENPRS